MKSLRYLIPAIVLSLTACDLGSVAPGDMTGGPGDLIPGAGRVVQGLQAQFMLNQGGGVSINGTGDGILPTLEIADPAKVMWRTKGLYVDQPNVIATAGPVTALDTACKTSNAITLEAWVTPASVLQEGPARILTYSVNSNVTNFVLGQSGNKVEARLRTSSTGENGTPATLSNLDAFTSTTQPVHIVYIRNGADDKGYVYLNGQIASEGTDVAGDFSTWSTEARLGIGTEIDGSRNWQGEIHLVAVYCRDLTPSEISDNFKAGF